MSLENPYTKEEMDGMEIGDKVERPLDKKTTLVIIREVKGWFCRWVTVGAHGSVATTKFVSD